MSGLELTVALVVVIVGVAALAFSLLAARTDEADKRRAHEKELARMEQTMWFAALDKPPVTMFSTRGRPIPRFVSEGAADVVRRAATPPEMERRLANVEKMLGGSADDVAAYVEKMDGSTGPDLSAVEIDPDVQPMVPDPGPDDQEPLS